MDSKITHLLINAAARVAAGRVILLRPRGQEGGDGHLDPAAHLDLRFLDVCGIDPIPPGVKRLRVPVDARVNAVADRLHWCRKGSPQKSSPSEVVALALGGFHGFALLD